MEKKNIPVVCIHEGNQEYLKYCIEKSEKNGNKMYLIGDYSNRDFCCDWRDIEEYITPEIKNFREMYIHNSCNSISFEMQCIERWFVLFEFMKREGLDIVCHIDSDLLLYCNISDIITEYDKAYFSFLRDEKNEIDLYSVSGHCAILSFQLLESFCKWIIETYSRKNTYLKEMFAYKRERKNPSVSDMLLLGYWAKTQKVEIVSLDLDIKTGVFDHNLNESLGYYMIPIKHTKIVLKIFNRVYFVSKTGLVRAYSIHAQGTAKKYMKNL